MMAAVLATLILSQDGETLNERFNRLIQSHGPDYLRLRSELLQQPSARAFLEEKLRSADSPQASIVAGALLDRLRQPDYYLKWKQIETDMASNPKAPAALYVEWMSVVLQGHPAGSMDSSRPYMLAEIVLKRLLPAGVRPDASDYKAELARSFYRDVMALLDFDASKINSHVTAYVLLLCSSETELAVAVECIENLGRVKSIRGRETILKILRASPPSPEPFRCASVRAAAARIRLNSDEAATKKELYLEILRAASDEKTAAVNEAALRAVASLAPQAPKGEDNVRTLDEKLKDALEEESIRLFESMISSKNSAALEAWLAFRWYAAWREMSTGVIGNLYNMGDWHLPLDGKSADECRAAAIERGTRDLLRWMSHESASLRAAAVLTSTKRILFLKAEEGRAGKIELVRALQERVAQEPSKEVRAIAASMIFILALASAQDSLGVQGSWAKELQSRLGAEREDSVKTWLDRALTESNRKKK